MTCVSVVLVVCWLAILSLILLWTTSRVLRPDHEPSGMDPILGVRDRVAVYRPSGPPSNLTGLPLLGGPGVGLVHRWLQGQG